MMNNTYFINIQVTFCANVAGNTISFKNVNGLILAPKVNSYTDGILSIYVCYQDANTNERLILQRQKFEKLKFMFYFTGLFIYFLTYQTKRSSIKAQSFVKRLVIYNLSKKLISNIIFAL